MRVPRVTHGRFIITCSKERGQASFFFFLFLLTFMLFQLRLLLLPPRPLRSTPRPATRFSHRRVFRPQTEALSRGKLVLRSSGKVGWCASGQEARPPRFFVVGRGPSCIACCEMEKWTVIVRARLLVLALFVRARASSRGRGSLSADIFLHSKALRSLQQWRCHAYNPSHPPLI